jgi:hypothetical protein
VRSRLRAIVALVQELARFEKREQGREEVWDQRPMPVGGAPR